MSGGTRYWWSTLVSIGLRNHPSNTEARTKEQEKALQKERHNVLRGIITFIKKSPQSNGLLNCFSNSLLARLCLARLSCLFDLLVFEPS